MQKIITRLLKKGNVAVGTQTETIEGFGENAFDFTSANEQEENQHISAAEIAHHESAHNGLHGSHM